MENQKILDDLYELSGEKIKLTIDDVQLVEQRTMPRRRQMNNNNQQRNNNQQKRKY